MAAKVFAALCASVLLVQTTSAQYIGNRVAEEIALGYGPGMANGLAYGGAPFGTYGPQALGYPLNSFAASSGCGFPVTSTSAIAPTGIKVVSENAIEGSLSIIGELPFLSAIAVEGSLPTAGVGAINYGAGNEAVGIVSEGIAPVYGPAAAASRFGYGAPGVAAPGLAGPGYGYGMAGYGAY